MNARSVACSPQHGVLLGAQALAPFGVGQLDPTRHRHITTSETATNCVTAAATTSRWKISWKPSVARERIRPLGGVDHRPERVEPAADDHQHRAGDPDAREHLRHGEDRRPSRRRGTRSRSASAASRSTRARARGRSAAPAQTITSTSHCVVPAKQRSANGVYVPGDEDEDHRVVEAPRPEPARSALPREAVVERARPEHRRERGRIDPGRDVLRAVRPRAPRARRLRRSRRRTPTGGRRRAQPVA